jgi:hypothetical protein
MNIHFDIQQQYWLSAQLVKDLLKTSHQGDGLRYSSICPQNDVNFNGRSARCSITKDFDVLLDRPK